MILWQLCTGYEGEYNMNTELVCTLKTNLVFLMSLLIRLNGVNQEVLSTSDSDFNLSPPQRNHQLTFNATNFAMRTLRDPTTLRNETFIIACGFVNGEDSTNIITPMNLTVRLQEGKH